jgi:hypothetical protein
MRTGRFYGVFSAVLSSEQVLYLCASDIAQNRLLDQVDAAVAAFTADGGYDRNRCELPTSRLDGPELQAARLGCVPPAVDETP